MGVSFRCPLTLVRKYFLPGAAVYAELPVELFAVTAVFGFCSLQCGSHHAGQTRVPIPGYSEDKVKIKWSLLGTIPSLSLLGPLWIIVRCH